MSSQTMLPINDGAVAVKITVPPFEPLVPHWSAATSNNVPDLLFIVTEFNVITVVVLFT